MDKTKWLLQDREFSLGYHEVLN